MPAGQAWTRSRRQLLINGPGFVSARAYLIARTHVGILHIRFAACGHEIEHDAEEVLGQCLAQLHFQVLAELDQGRRGDPPGWLASVLKLERHFLKICGLQGLRRVQRLRSDVQGGLEFFLLRGRGGLFAGSL
ncbi:MAG: hypothetical protein Q7T63_01485 [Burkholderiaceae bacterium]|nr:hypothetical protein [Burkholderiaceae bacterium]MDO9090706.1 hypothetical protein [Burkholderiaceae bacterium]